MGYKWATPNGISASEAHNEIDLNEAGALIPGLKKSISGLAGVLHGLKKALIVVRCPADASFPTRKEGTRELKTAGWSTRSREQRCWHPARWRSTDSPWMKDYQFTISGTGSGELDLDIIAPENETGLDLVSFQKIAISRGSKVTGEAADRCGHCLSAIRLNGNLIHTRGLN